MKFRVDVTTRQTYRVDVDELQRRFPEEWAEWDQEHGGDDLLGWVRETVDNGALDDLHPESDDDDVDVDIW